MQFVNGTTVQGNGTGSVATVCTLSLQGYGGRLPECSHLNYQAAGVQYAVGLATNVSTTVIYPGQEDDTDSIQGLFDITHSLLAQDTPPHVFLTSVQYEESAFQTAPEVAQ